MSLLSNYLPRGIVPVSQQTITESITINLDEAQLALVVLVGGGGSGGVAYGAAGENILHAQGGNAGGVCMQLLRFKASTDYTITINSGGTAQTRTSAGASDGVAGGDVVLSSTALASNITAYGGDGGIAAQYDIDSGTYGTDIGYNTQTFGAGADLIFDGGSGGKITIPTKNTSKSHAIATGGGAANLFGLPATFVRGGDAVVTSADATRIGIATGGGGVGGTGGDVSHQALAWTVASGGGGAAGGGADYSGVPTAHEETAGGNGSLFTPQVLFPLDGAGLDGHYANGSNPSLTTAGTGAGGGGVINVSTTYGDPINGGPFGGGGGVAGSGTTGSTITAGSGQYGGGGGGVCHSAYDSSFSGTLTSGAGGAGIAFVFFLSDFGKVLT